MATRRTWNNCAVASAVFGIVAVIAAALYKEVVDGRGPYLDPVSNVVLSSKIGEGVLIGGAVVGIGGSCLFTWLERRKR